MYIDNNGEKWQKVALHLHTTVSDGVLTPEEVAEVYKEAGFDAIAFTDHWKFQDTKSVSGLNIISGCEYNVGGADSVCGVMHIVGVGMKEEPHLTRENSEQEIIDAIKECGGIAILAHPAWSLNSIDDVKDLHGFEAVEIFNSVSETGQSSRPYSGYFVDLLSNKGTVMGLVATDDAHYYDEIDRARSYIMVKAESSETEDILKGIKNGDYFASQGPVLSVIRDGDKIIAECSDCVRVDFLSNSVWDPDKIVRGENLMYAEFKIKKYTKWVRVEVVDKNGNFAWSNIISI